MLVNRAQIYEEWAPMLESSAGITDKYKLGWLSEYCHNHSKFDGQELNEGIALPGMATLSNTLGVGQISTGSTLGSGINGFYTGATGSGDKFPSLLPMSIQVAQRTIGFDVVSVIPMNGPTGVLSYLDYVYAGGRLDSSDKPTVVAINAPDINSTAYVVGNAYWGCTAASGSQTTVALTFVGYSKYTGYPMFRVFDVYTAATIGTNIGTLNTNGKLSDVFTGTTSIIAADKDGSTTFAWASSTGTAQSAQLGSVRPELIRAYEDHIQGFAGAGTQNTNKWSANYVDPTLSYNAMRRDVGETSQMGSMAVQVYTKFVEAETFQVSANVTIEQVQDLKRQFGVDVMNILENALVNEISQSINKHILSRMFALGWQSNYDMLKTEGQTLNSTLAGSDGSKAYVGKLGSTLTIKTVAWASFGNYENQATTLARIQAKLIAAGNIIAVRGKRGPANFAITNLQIATALQASAQFTLAPINNNINQNNGSLYPIGNLAGITIYVDPNMRYDDTRVCVGRKGGDEEPGLKMMPYLMAERFTTIPGETMAPKIAVKSRYALVEAGQIPQSMYYTFVVDCNGKNLLG